MLNRHDGGVEASPYPAVTAKAHSSTQRIPDFVGRPSAEAHFSLVETTIAAVTAGKDTAKAHSSTQGIPDLVGRPSAEAHLSFVETTIATVTAGKDTAEDTSEGPSRCVGTTEHQREVNSD